MWDCGCGTVDVVKQNRRFIMATLLKRGEKNISIYGGSVFCIVIKSSDLWLEGRKRVCSRLWLRMNDCQ
jgi:hypothetical protein